LLRIVNEQADQILGKPGGDDNLLDIAVPLKQAALNRRLLR
jgi:hypothetical protein